MVADCLAGHRARPGANVITGNGAFGINRHGDDISHIHVSDEVLVSYHASRRSGIRGDEERWNQNVRDPPVLHGVHPIGNSPPWQIERTHAAAALSTRRMLESLLPPAAAANPSLT